MADLYVSSVDGSDADNGTTWALAKATVTGALAIAADGDCIYVDSAHSESSGAAIVWNVPTAGYRVAIISVNRNGSATTGHAGWLAGATATVGVNGAAFSINSANSGTLFIYGLSIIGNSGSGNSNLVNLGTNANSNLTLAACTVTAPGTGTSVTIVIGTASVSSNGSNVRVRDTQFLIRDATSGVAGGLTLQKGTLEFAGVTVGYAGASKPPRLLTFSEPHITRATFFNCDLSGYENASGNYVDVTAMSGALLLQNCKLSASPGLVTGTWPGNTGSLTLINTDSGDTHNVFEFRNRLGTLTESTSVYADSGGQFDAAGISWQLVTTADCNEAEPFVTPWLHRWSEDTAQITAGLEIVHDSATDLTDRTAWPEFEYVGNASFPLGTLASGRFATPFEGTAADWANSSDAWTGTGGFANANKQTLAATFTPAEKSLLRARLNVGVASKTLYLDPALRITGYDANPAVRWTRDGAFNAEPSGGGGGGSIFSSLIIRGVN